MHFFLFFKLIKISLVKLRENISNFSLAFPKESLFRINVLYYVKSVGGRKVVSFVVTFKKMPLVFGKMLSTLVYFLILSFLIFCCIIQVEIDLRKKQIRSLEEFYSSLKNFFGHTKLVIIVIFGNGSNEYPHLTIVIKFAFGYFANQELDGVFIATNALCRNICKLSRKTQG